MNMHTLTIVFLSGLVLFSIPRVHASDVCADFAGRVNAFPVIVAFIEMPDVGVAKTLKMCVIARE